MKIAITLLTCGRTDYTRRTLSTLCRQNPNLADDFVLLHGDDHASLADATESRKLAKMAGFETVLSPSLQYGVARMTELLFQEAEKRGCEAVLNLQNDWESLRPIPVNVIPRLLEDRGIYTFRLYGKYKSPGKACGIHHGGREPREVVQWTPDLHIPGIETGEIHWGHPPAVTRMAEAMDMVRGAGSESVSRRRSGALKLLTARVTDNIFSHIGEHRTARFRP